MAINSIGYDGSVNEAAWAELVRGMVSDYGVANESDWRVAARPAPADRTVRVATGTGWGKGVLDTSTTNYDIQLDPVASGSRHDLIVARRTWTGVGGTTQFIAVKGGSSSTTLPGRQVNRGIDSDDQPLALVRVTAGQQQPTVVADLRVWAANGGLVALDERVLQYLTQPGTEVAIGNRTWKRVMTSGTGSAWEIVGTRLRIGATGAPFIGSTPAASTLDTRDFFVITDNIVLPVSGSSDVNWQIPGGGFPNGILSVHADVMSVDGNGNPTGLRAVPWTGTSVGLQSTKARVYFRIFRADGTLAPRVDARMLVTAIGW